MAGSVDFVVLAIGSDLASSCQRLKVIVGTLLRKHNASARVAQSGVALFVDSFCAAHVLQRETAHTFEKKVLTTRLFSTAWCCSLPSVYSELAAALDNLVREDLRVGFFPGAPPPPGLARHHIETLVNCVFLRFTPRASQRSGGDEHARRQASEFLRLLNGDLRAPCIQHYCYEPGCCTTWDGRRSPDIAAKRISALLKEVFLSAMGSNLPSATRWYTFVPHLSLQLGSLCCHSWLPRLLRRTLGAAAGKEGADDKDSFHRVANKRKRVAVEFMQAQPGSALSLLYAFIGSGPAERLSHELQRMDDSGGGLRDLTDISNEENAVHAAQKDYWEIANPWSADVGPSEPSDTRRCPAFGVFLV